MKNQTLPKYKKGDRLVMMDENPDYTFPHDDNMVVDDEPQWYSYERHQMMVIGNIKLLVKRMNVRKIFLTPYVEGQKEYNIELLCHIYFKQSKLK
jgi:hypothetical protein